MRSSGPEPQASCPWSWGLWIRRSGCGFQSFTPISGNHKLSGLDGTVQTTDPGHTSLDINPCLGLWPIILTLSTCTWNPRKLHNMEAVLLSQPEMIAQAQFDYLGCQGAHSLLRKRRWVWNTHSGRGVFILIPEQVSLFHITAF